MVAVVLHQAPTEHEEACAKFELSQRSSNIRGRDNTNMHMAYMSMWISVARAIYQYTRVHSIACTLKPVETVYCCDCLA
jgi:hypothetical protein